MDRLDGLMIMLKEVPKYARMTGKENHGRGWSQWKWKKGPNSPKIRGWLEVIVRIYKSYISAIPIFNMEIASLQTFSELIK